MGSLVVVCELLVMAYGIWFPDQGWSPGPLHWEHGVLALGHQGSPKLTLYLFDIVLHTKKITKNTCTHAVVANKSSAGLKIQD